MVDETSRAGGEAPGCPAARSRTSSGRGCAARAERSSCASTRRPSLLELCRVATERGLDARLVVDAGLTEVPAGTRTAVGIGPHLDSAFAGVTDHLNRAPR